MFLHPSYSQEFVDKDSSGNEYSFRGMKHVCTSDYYLENGFLQWSKMVDSSFVYISGQVVQMHPCQVSAEVDGTNHKTSHDGMFKV